MADLFDMTKKDIPSSEGEPAITVPPAAPPNPMAEIARATGLNLAAGGVPADGDDISPVSTPQLMAGNIPVPPIAVPPPAPAPAPMVEDASQLDQGAKALDPVEMGFAQEEAKFQKVQAEKQAGMEAMFADTLKQEEERLKRMEEKEEEIRVETVNVTHGDRTRAIRESNDPDIADVDLTPGYSEEDMKEAPEDGVTPQSDVKAEDAPPSPGDDQYGEYIRNLPTTTLDNVDPKKSPVMILRTPKITTAKKQNKQTLGDQAFMNAVTRFKKDNFGKADACLVNSGFFASVVGTGVVDMQNLYMNVSRDTSIYEYELEQMRAVIKNVVGTNPKINPNQLSQMIHYRDFEILSFSHVCATLEKVETVTNCKECGNAFRLESAPQELVLNEDEMHERKMRISGAANIEEVSLMTTVKKIETSVGIVVTLGHPSYAEYIRGVRGFQEKAAEMTPADARRFQSMLDMLHFVRSVELPSGVKTNSIYQSYIAMGLLADVDFDAVSREVDEMKKQIIVPQYGIRECRCPTCGAINKNIPYRSLLDLLFYHTTVSSFLNNPES